MSSERLLNRKKIVFVSSSFVNLARDFAEHFVEFDVFLILDRKFPFEFEDLDNFYPFSFDYQKLFNKDKVKYFDNLSVFIDEFRPDVVVFNNFTKLVPKSFVEFLKFRNSKIEILNVHHGDLRKGEDFVGLNADMKQFLTEEEIVTTIHKVEDERMDAGEQLAFTEPTNFKELKQKGLFNNKSDIMNLRLRNVALTFHERTKVMRVLYETVCKFVFKE